MAYWLLKSEPGAWSWDDQAKAKTSNWDGVRNYQAANNLKAMRRGDFCFFYHSVNEKRIVGIVEVTKEHYPDPTDKDVKFVVVDFKTDRELEGELERYRRQVRIYAAAIGQATGKPVRAVLMQI